MKVNRFEVIDHTSDGEGREFVKWVERAFHVETTIQDDGKTFKVFLSDKERKIPDVS